MEHMVTPLSTIMEYQQLTLILEPYSSLTFLSKETRRQLLLCGIKTYLRSFLPFMPRSKVSRIGIGWEVGKRGVLNCPTWKGSSCCEFWPELEALRYYLQWPSDPMLNVVWLTLVLTFVCSSLSLISFDAGMIMSQSVFDQSHLGTLGCYIIFSITSFGLWIKLPPAEF